jgi:signal transduction histidine kinase
LPIAPILVAVIAVAAAVGIAAVGANQLQRTSDEQAALRSKALAATLAARLRSTDLEQRGALLTRAARVSGAAVLLVDRSGTILVDDSVVSLTPSAVSEFLAKAEGTAETPAGRMRYAASSVSPPMEDLSVLALVSAPSPAEGTLGLSRAVAVLTLLLLGIAVSVALVFMKAARDDVMYVRHRIADMARGGSEVSSGVTAGGVPLRSLDQVGMLTAALNVLIARFAAAEQGYRKDLRAAAQLDTDRSQFLAGLSHELRTPLNAILGFTHLLESEQEGPLGADAKEALAMIRTSGEHLKSLIDDILDLSAMESGQLRLTRQIVDVRTLAEEVVREGRATVLDRPVRVWVEGERGSLAWADPRRLRQVLSNLLSNALKATVRGEVRVTVGRRDGAVVVHVSDSGRGIDPGVLESIFEPYKQAGDASTRRGGTGLGLAITRRLVLLHGGAIEAVSQPGRGSTFTVTFPDDSHSSRVPRDSLVPWEAPKKQFVDSGRITIPPPPRTPDGGPK